MPFSSAFRWLGPLLLGCFVALGSSAALAAETPSQQLHAPWNALLNRYVSREGHVDYSGLMEDEDQLDGYLQQLRKTAPDQANWSRAEQEAYWLNAYNAASLYMVLQYYPVRSMNEIKVKALKGSKSAWEAPCLTIGGREYSLNQIEREVLRDKFHDPRAHFAIGCTGQSSPPLLNEAYDGSRLDQQLDEQVRAFLANPNLNQLTPDRARVSSLFDWYAAEFGEGKTLVSWLNKYAATPVSLTATIEFLPYDWALNDRARQSENQALR